MNIFFWIKPVWPPDSKFGYHCPKGKKLWTGKGGIYASLSENCERVFGFLWDRHFSHTSLFCAQIWLSQSKSIFLMKKKIAHVTRAIITNLLTPHLLKLIFIKYFRHHGTTYKQIDCSITLHLGFFIWEPVQVPLMESLIRIQEWAHNTHCKCK